MLEKCLPFHMSRSRNASVASASSLTSQRSPDSSSQSSLASTPTSTSASFSGLDSPRRARRTLARLARAANYGPRRLGPILRKLSSSPGPSSSPTTPSLIWPTLPSVDPSPRRALAEPAARTQTATHASASLGTISDASRQRTRSLRIASTCADIRQVCVLLRPVAETFPGVKIAVSVVEGILTLV